MDSRIQRSGSRPCESRSCPRAPGARLPGWILAETAGGRQGNVAGAVRHRGERPGRVPGARRREQPDARGDGAAQGGARGRRLGVTGDRWWLRLAAAWGGTGPPPVDGEQLASPRPVPVSWWQRGGVPRREAGGLTASAACASSTLRLEGPRHRVWSAGAVVAAAEASRAGPCVRRRRPLRPRRH